MHARIATDLNCIHCGYNLRTLAHDARCPECGHAVRDTLESDQLCFAPARYVRRLATGVGLLFFVATEALLFTGILFVAQPKGRTLVTAFSLVVIATALAAIWFMTVCDPRTTGRSEGMSARRALRVSGLVTLGAAGALMYWNDVRATAGFSASMILLVGTLLVTPATFVIYALQLLRRLPSPRMVALGRVLGLVFAPVYAMVTIVAILIVPFAAGSDPSVGAAACAFLVLFPIVLLLLFVFVVGFGAALSTAAAKAAAFEQRRVGCADRADDSA